jgi:hypothetical protein
MDKTKNQRTYYNDEQNATNRFTQHCLNFAQNASDVPFCILTATTAVLCIFPPQHYPSLKYNNTTYKVLATFEYKGNLVNETNLVHYFFLVYFVNFIYNLYMFQTSPGPSSGGTTVFM